MARRVAANMPMTTIANYMNSRAGRRNSLPMTTILNRLIRAGGGGSRGGRAGGGSGGSGGCLCQQFYMILSKHRLR